MALKCEIGCDVETAFELLTDPDFLVQRSMDLGELSAECEVEEDGDVIRVIQRRELERELPSFLAKIFSANQDVEMTEEWKRKGNAYVGSFDYIVHGQPIRIKGTFELKPKGKGCVYTVKHDIKVKIPLIGGKAEKFATAQTEDGVQKELDYTKEQLG
ncbi:MAG: DUF2505 domain-containing protein [Deltaproteobacteria bacterium]|nr:DUF2505 domain-containing protein [Deltaproteobacteria bacterium]